MFGIATGQFIGQNIHFAICLFAALACFAAGWLYFDAWTERHHRIDLPKWGGFFLLALGFLVSGAAWDTGSLLDAIGTGLKLFGYVALLVGNLFEPIQPRPSSSDMKLDDTSAPARPGTQKAPGLMVAATAGISFVLPVAALAIAFLYWRRATTGLERHLKPIAGVFLAFALADAFGLAKLWRSSENPLVQQITAPFGAPWFAEHVILLLGGIWLMWWVWRYLTKRLLTQLFITMTNFTVTIVLVATISITGLLLSSLQKDALSSLETATKVLSYAVSGKTAETRADATVIAQTPSTVQAVAAGDHKTLTKLAGDMLVKQHLSDVIITGDSGQVLVRASDPDRYGDSISDDSLVKRALVGTAASSTASRTGVLAPELVITSASPVRSGDKIIGVALTSLSLDNAFVDGIKHTTGLDSAVYAGNTRTATTLVGPDGTSRSIGSKETNAKILDTTLTHATIWRGAQSVSNQAYLSVYLPLKDVDNTVVGMLFVGQPQDTVLHSAQAAVKLTLISAVLWLIVIMFPIYFISRLISRELQ